MLQHHHHHHLQGPGTGDDPIGGTAPIGSGLIILISMGAAYGAKKVYNARKRLEE